MINHSVSYNIAFLMAQLEFWGKFAIYGPNRGYYSTILGIAFSLVGHTFRLGAFISAKRNIHHLVQRKKAEGHVLVKNGIYSVSRHPSYFGFFVYSLGG
jgi:protein-S-isoprenylcysteine O-methyltransferase